ncbi:MAG TPA: tRNA (N(6)-L-threonylcarbamoyladenosine(37)-C(2))-methylthiotransferase MtaB, partial [Lachnospiraceae bacterium]|nr:tRNA (N(6)-L-threonylcarbamoyladenosine(37)-C(2))-methylthiotransferase MtaB [Lachnospiraceae bacterium]
IAEAAKRGRRYREWYAGRPLEVLFEEKQEINGQFYQTGYTKEYVKAAVRREEDLCGKIVRGKAERMLTDEILVFSGELE